MTAGETRATIAAAFGRCGATTAGRIVLSAGSALFLLAAAKPENRIVVTLPPALAAEASGRLLVFAEPVTNENSQADDVDLGRSGDAVSVAGRDVRGFGAGRSVVIDTRNVCYPRSFAALKPGAYRMQAVLDRDGDYNYAGRGAGDLVSKVVTVSLPLTATPAIPLDHAVPPEPDQFDTTGLPPIAAEQITASRPHLHEERVASKLLTRFSGATREIRAWVLTPPGYDQGAKVTYPTIYTAGGFGATHRLNGQQLSRQWHLMQTGALPPMIWVALDFSSPTGTSEFADSASNGPWGEALVSELIPTLEARYRMDAKASGRFLTGHSSGGWFALWTIVRHPELFGASWATSPDPVDFHDFLGVDLYATAPNLYRAADGAPRPLERDHGKVTRSIEEAARLERVLGHDGGQLRSFEWTFSPRGAAGRPAMLFDRDTGAISPAVSAHWRDRYDIARLIEVDWPQLAPDLDGKIHVVVGTEDSYYLDGPVHRLDAAFRKVGGRAEFRYVPGATHAVSMVYAKDGDRNALWKDMTREMYAVARPGAKVAINSPSAPVR
jgi:enterochelin esterase-like enzyme